jgi:hypothetical protein
MNFTAEDAETRSFPERAVDGSGVSALSSWRAEQVEENVRVTPRVLRGLASRQLSPRSDH